jgi:hypothetical protein
MRFAGKRRTPLKPLAFIGGVAALVLVLAPFAASAGPDEHFLDIGTDTDTDFCGTGETIDVASEVPRCSGAACASRKPTKKPGAASP